MNEFLEKIKLILNDEFDDFLNCYEGENFRGLRVNTLKTSFEELNKIIGFDLKKTPFCKNGAYMIQLPKIWQFSPNGQERSSGRIKT